MNLTAEQKIVYNRLIKARNNVALGQYRLKNKNPWQPTSDVTRTVDVDGQNHPVFELNEEWFEYKEAFEAWMAVEPPERKAERMSMIKGDYGDSDNWQEKKSNLREVA